MKNLYCRLFNHDFIIKSEITKFVKEYTCLNCGKQLTTSDQGELIPLTDKRRETNEELRKLYIKRRKLKKNAY
ncbi:hypothetical protein LX77_01220 [Gelidibacter algens]|uniref:Prophage protein DUF1660 n=1 Tax=Gelidibacter algens TaxID=49280 RepID=A0A1A7R0F7_9FLAO|nr:hypothetical protein A9996_10675 [Gelidibacter algens]RAJ25804.1 hypothetical protein LX77_01220 [Gelidibacter algens]